MWPLSRSRLTAFGLSSRVEHPAASLHQPRAPHTRPPRREARGVAQPRSLTSCSPCPAGPMPQPGQTERRPCSSRSPPETQLCAGVCVAGDPTPHGLAPPCRLPGKAGAGCMHRRSHCCVPRAFLPAKHAQAVLQPEPLHHQQGAHQGPATPTCPGRPGPALLETGLHRIPTAKRDGGPSRGGQRAGGSASKGLSVLAGRGGAGHGEVDPRPGGGARDTRAATM